MAKHNNHRPGNSNPSKGKENHSNKTQKSGGKGPGRGGSNGGKR